MVGNILFPLLCMRIYGRTFVVGNIIFVMVSLLLEDLWQNTCLRALEINFFLSHWNKDFWWNICGQGLVCGQALEIFFFKLFC